MSSSCPPAGESETPTAEALFHEMVALPPEQWEAYLEQACAPDREPALHSEVMGLLHGHEQAGGFLPFETATSPMFRRPAAPLPEKPGDQIGPYKLMEQIGEGGFGVVWVAEQEKPVRRRVALKILKPGMDTKQVIARFEQERQALAMMDHPNIAKVLDAGATPFGRPFFVMELVKGVKITQYCDQAHLSTKDRLRLFIAVCQAVQHAHQKGVIHRDLKPSNILVTLHDGVPVPKVIDFGVAKATQQQRLTDLTIYTQFEQLVGTPLYMSPEQAELSGLDIDTRSDIYSLGVLLYELLTGRTPFDPETLMKRGLEEIRRAVREQEPQKPSTFVSTLALDLRTDLARRRQTDSAKLVGQIRGDLDWIVMKALEKDRARRYETATGLAQDIHRHLGSEPVLARPPTMGYRFRRFARRHKATFAASAAVLTALIIGLGATTWMFYMERRARMRAVAAEQAQEQERQKAELEAAKSQQVVQFLTDMLKGVGPSVALGRDTTMLREIMDETVERFGKELKDQPEIEGYLRFYLGRVYSELEDNAKAEEIYREVLEKQKNLTGIENEQKLAQVLSALAGVLAKRGKFSEAEAMGREGLAMSRKLLGPEHPDVAHSLNNLTGALRNPNQLPEAEAMQREAVALHRKKLSGANHPDLANSLVNLASLMNDQGKLTEADAIFREALAMQRTLFGNEHPDVARTLNTLAKTLYLQNKLTGAEPLFREGLAINRKVLSNDHPDLESSLNNLATLLADQGNYTEAETMFSEVLVIQRKHLGPEHPDVANSIIRLATTLLGQKKPADAEPLFREGLEIQRKVLGNDHPDLGLSLNNLASLLANQGKYADAEALFREALAIQRKGGGDNDSEINLSQVIHNLAVALHSQGKSTEAEPLFREALVIRRNHLGPEHPDIAESLHKLAHALEMKGDLKGAESTHLEALDMLRKLGGPESLTVANHAACLAKMLLAANEFAAAEQFARESLAIREKKLPDDWMIFNSRSLLGGSLLGQHKFAEAEPLLVSGYEGIEQRADKIPRGGQSNVKQCLERVVQFYEATQNPVQAAAWKRKLDALGSAEAPPASGAKDDPQGR